MGQTQLADFLRVSASTVGMYEQELSVPDMDALVQLAQLLDVSLDYLITGKESHCKPFPVMGRYELIPQEDGSILLRPV